MFALAHGTHMTPTALRIPAQEIEQLVSMRLLELLTNQGELMDAVNEHIDDAQKLKLAIVRGNSMARNWWGMASSQKRDIFLALIKRIDLSDKTTAISLSPKQLIKLLMDGPNDCPPASKTSEKEEQLILRVDFDLRQCGLGIRMLVDGRPAGNRAEPNQKLIRLIATAHRMFEKLACGKGLKIKEIAEQEGYGDSYATRIMRLAFLSPDITAAILNGTQTPDITPDTLMLDTRLPLDWNDHAEFIKAE